MDEKDKKNIDRILRDIRSGRVNDRTINLAAGMDFEAIPEKYRTIVKATAGSVLGSRLRRPVNEVLQTLARAENLL
ncbi:hypothetical protein TFLX_06082 [Thermoflexales bacterium]|nr:hypothetical protein TFLX_06082 [Thermoflexales bacterium]